MCEMVPEDPLNAVVNMIYVQRTQFLAQPNTM